MGTGLGHGLTWARVARIWARTADALASRRAQRVSFSSSPWRAGGGGASRPMAWVTASANLAGWAVARQMTSPRPWAARTPVLRQGRLVADGHGGEIGLGPDQPVTCHLQTAVPAHALQQASHQGRVLIDQVIEVALEVGGDLDVHRRAQGRIDLPRGIDPGMDEAAEDIVAVGGDDQPLDRQAHALGQVAGEDVAKVAGGDGEADLMTGIATGHPPPGVEVIDHLGEDARPVDGIDGAQAQLTLELQVAEELLDDALTVVEGAADGDGMDVGVQHRRHLPFLNGRDAPVREEDEDLDARLATHPGDGRRPRIPRGGADDIEPAAIPFQQVFKEIAQELQGHILEGRRRTVEEFQQPLISQAHHRRHLRVGEGGVGALDQIRQVVPGDGIADEGGHDL